MGVRIGAEYLAGLRDGREVWLEGARVQDVAAHPRLGRTARTIAALYDLQHDPDLHEQMTFPSPSSGEPVALSYLMPQSIDDLLRRRRALEVIVEQLCASGLMLTPTEADVRGPIRETIARYYQGAQIGGEERIQLFRLAWDLTGTQFGSRQALYERFFNGDVVRLRQTRYQTYDYSRAVGMVDRFLRQVVEGPLTPSPNPSPTS